MLPPPTVDLSGLWIPIVTPFAHDGSLDRASLERLTRRLLADGADGLVALGTTGEPATLDREERRAVVEICDQVCREAGRPLVVGAGSNNTQETIDEIDLLTAGTSAAAALVVVPYYTRPSEMAVVEHFQIVADSSPVPVVLYNIPYRTGRGLGPDAILEAAAHPNIIGLKQSVAALDIDTLDVIAQAPADFSVLAGDDAFVAPTVLMGAAGAIAAAAHVCTPLFAEMIHAARSDDATRAVQIATNLLPVVKAGFREPSPAVWKATLAATGAISSPAVRRPMTAASEVATTRLVNAAAEASRALSR